MDQEKTAYYIEIENTPEGWARLPGLARGMSRIAVSVRISSALTDNQLFALRHCMIALDRLEYQLNKSVSLSLHITVLTQEDAYRIQHYLTTMTTFRGITLNTYAGKNLVPQLHNPFSARYRIIPLFCVSTAKLRWAVQYLYTVGLGNVAEAQSLIHAGLWKGPSSASMPSPHSPQAVFDRILMNNLWSLQQEISGKAGENMLESDKSKLQQELAGILEAEMPLLGMLSRLLWSMFLRSLSDSKYLFFRDSANQWHINKETLRCTRLDAVSYAEGMLQLIENACIHSDMQRSYVSIRLSDVDITGTGVMRVAKAAQTRVDIRTRYQAFWQDPSGKTPVPPDDPPDDSSIASPGLPQYELERQAKFCLEFSVLNDSTTRKNGLMGITDMFLKNRSMDSANFTMEKVFTYQGQNVSDASRHYGLRLLEKTVQLNRGLFLVHSPRSDGSLERYGSFSDGSIRRVCRSYSTAQDPCTDFDVLLPIYPHWHDHSEPEETSLPPESLFLPDTLEQEVHSQTILRLQAQVLALGNVDSPHASFFTVERYLQPPKTPPWTGWAETPSISDKSWLQQKDRLVSLIWHELRAHTETASGDDIYLLDLMQVWDVLSLELLAKAVFLLIAWRTTQGEPAVRMAVLLPNNMFISEFIRIFSIFYDKQLAKTPWMGESQIAFCSYSNTAPYLPQVLFLMGGTSSSSARATSRVFSYYSTGSVLELIPQIRYLTRQEDAAPVSQFPFDLFLTAVPESREKFAQTPWFLQEIAQKLDSALWQRSHGCHIQGVHVRLHSNIYLSDFYEAELLFHNVGIIYRFAHMIAKDLLGQLPPGSEQKPLVVVGYGLYSTVLIEQIAKLLSPHVDVDYLIYSIEQGGGPLHLSPKLKAMDKTNREQSLQRAQYVMVLPIGTTMSTMYQIKREIEARWGGQSPYNHYVLILVADNGKQKLATRYWTQTSPGYIELTPQKKNELGLQCRYYLEPGAQWSRGCDNAGVDEQVLVYVDQSSTRPKEIFVVEGSHFKGISHFLGKSAASAAHMENTRRLQLLQGLIQYGHIAEGNNHFQFYLDMERYYARAQQQQRTRGHKTVTQWLQSLRDRIDPNAYNIIVSPLRQENSPFVKSVIDQVFEHSLRFLHIDLNAAFREDVRAKFSYIADEYQKIRLFDKNKPVNVYFVNMVITTGQTLSRARSLVTMLMEESGVEYDPESIFKGCFVLVNRSAYDTINSYVKDPDQYFFAYLHLAVPSFNVRQDRCPTCELLDQYRTLEYSSAGNFLGQEFRRLRVKNAKRTKTEHRAWLEGMAMSSGGYAGWLRQWLYAYVQKERRAESKLWVGIFDVDEVTFADLKALYSLLTWGIAQHLARSGITPPGPGAAPQDREMYLDAINSFSLHQLAQLVSANREAAENAVGEDHLHCLEPEYWRHVLIDYVCAQKSYMRLVSSHHAFLRMDRMTDELQGDIPARCRYSTEVLATLIQAALDQAGTRQLQAEWLISYLKVLSRPHLAQYHHIRQGILTLMLQMVSYAIGASDVLPQHLSFAEPFLRKPRRETCQSILLRYQVLQTLLKRLAGLQSTYFLQGENMRKIWNTLSQMQESFLACGGGSDAKLICQQFNPFPSQQQMEKTLIKLVKWASACGDDENGCHLIEKSFGEGGDMDHA